MKGKSKAGGREGKRQDSRHSLNNSVGKQQDAWMDSHVACKSVIRAWVRNVGERRTCLSLARSSIGAVLMVKSLWMQTSHTRSMLSAASALR